MRIYIFITVMWGLIFFGGWVVVNVLQPIELMGFPWWVESGLKGTVALVLVIIWVVLMNQVKKRLVV